jgi:hypothetical protein
MKMCTKFRNNRENEKVKAVLVDLKYNFDR